jgi:protein TonB
LQEEGVVELRLELLQNGTVRALEVARSSGFRRLDEAALSAAKTWRFNPRTGGGDVEVIPYRVVFRLE